MRTKEAIENDIKKYKDKLAKLEDEFSERAFYDFYKKYGVKAGDIVLLKKYGKVHKVQVVNVDKHYTRFILCKKLKKDGEPAKNYVSYHDSDFEYNKVVGHKEVEL